MKLNETRIARPIPVFGMNVSSTQPRVSGPIERVAVSAIARLGESPAGESTILDVMEHVLGWPEMGSFLQDALNELCSPLVNGLTMNDPANSPMDSPLNNFRLTENGRHILETGVIPAVGHQQGWEMPYDTIENEFLDPQNLFTELHGIPHLKTFEPSFPEDQIRKRLKLSKAYSAPNVILDEIQPGSVEWLWKSENISAELKNGEVSIHGKTEALTQYLNALPTEDIERIFSWSSQTEQPVITDLEDLNAEWVTPLSKFPAIKRKADVVFHSESNHNSPFQANLLEILQSDSTTVPYLEFEKGGKPAKLHISALRDWNEEAVSNLKTVLSPVTARLTFNNTPILADFIVEIPLSDEDQARLKNQIITEILEVEMTEIVGPAEICACILLLDPQSEAAADFLTRQKDLESVLQRLQNYSKQAGFETEPLLARLQEKVVQPTNLAEAMGVYRLFVQLNFPHPEKVFRNGIAEEIVRSIWNRPEARRQLREIPELVPVCELSTRMDDLQKLLGVPMLKPDLELPVNVAEEELARLCTEWLGLHQRVMKNFSTQETFCEDLMQSVQNLKNQAEERIQADDEIQTVLPRRVYPFGNSPSRERTQKPYQNRTAVRNLPPRPNRSVGKPQYSRNPQSRRTVFVLDVFTLLEIPEILQYQNPRFFFVVPVCVEEKLCQWNPSKPREAQNKSKAFELLHRNPNIYCPDYQEGSNLDSILAAASEFSQERMFLVSPHPQLWELAKDNNFQILYPSKCLKMLEEATSRQKGNFHDHNHFRKGA